MKLSDEALLAAIDSAEALALGPTSTEIASDRADAVDRYLGKPYGDEQPGRSAVVSRDVSDVVEGVAANVLKPFVAGDRVVEFNPRGPEDEQAAQQETDYINFVVLERNNGFLALTSAVKDALLLRNGYIKLGWTIREDITLETYQGLSGEELTALTQDEDVEVVQQAEYPDPFAQAAAQMQQPQQPAMAMMAGQPPGAQTPPQVPMLHDVKVRRKRPTEFCELTPAPADEILVSQRSTEPSLQNADFVQHRAHKTLSELRQAGYKVPDDLGDDDESSQTIEDFARQRFGIPGDMWDDETNDPSRRIVLFKESWIRIDRDGDGIAELRRVCSVGHTLLADDEADLIPIACFTSVIFPHRHLGVSLYDQIKDLAQIKTALLRSYLDNRYLANNAEKVINVDSIDNVDDFLTSRPGGIKRVHGDPTSIVMPLVTPDTGAGALQGLEYLDSVRENRTGYTKSSQGLDSESLVSQTATGLMQQLSQSQLRLEMGSRTIAETGMRDLFRLVHALTLKHSSKEEKVRLRNKWVLVNPREWVRRTDLQISVGLGTTSGVQQIQNLMLLGQAQQQAMPLGLVRPENVFNTLTKLVNAMGFKNPEEFFTAPQPGQQPPQQPAPEVQAAQIAAQGLVQQEQIKQQAQMAMQPAELENKRQIALIQKGADLIIAQGEQSNDMMHNVAMLQQRAHQINLDHQRKVVQGAQASHQQETQSQRDDKFRRDTFQPRV